MISFDEYPIVYWALGHILAAILIYACIRPQKLSSFLFGLASIALLVMMRFPVVVFNHELNPDESQIISHALTLRHNPIYWQSVDGTTIGPLDNYFLVLLKFFGGQIDYTTTHLAALICCSISLLSFFLTIRNLYNDSVARLALLPHLFFLSLTQEPDYVHYTSEQLPLVLLNLSLWLASGIVENTKTKWWTFALIGFVLTMIPFAKLQASLQAVFVGLGVMGLLLQRKQYKNIIPLIMGVFVFVVIVLSFLLRFNLVADFWQFYIQGNLVYASGGSDESIVTQLIRLVQLSPDFLIYVSTVLGVITVALFARFVELPSVSSQTRYLLFSIGLLLVSVYSVLKSGNPFTHYLNLLIFPLAMFAAVMINEIQRKQLLFSISIIPLLFWSYIFIPKAINHRALNSYISTTDHTLQRSDITKKILEYSQPNDKLVVWGWACNYYVETQLAQGTAENHTERCIYNHPMRQVYRQRFITDMKRNRPAVFIDAVGKNSVWVQDIKTQGHEYFNDLNIFISGNYNLVATVDEVRIYVLNERLKRVQ